MKIAIGMKIQRGPFGGGNQFGKALTDYLKNKGIKVVFDLKDADIDLILLTDPRKYIKSNAFNSLDILDYVNNVNKDVILVQRINECDERKKTKTINKQLFLSNSIMDHTIFIASWLIALFVKQNYDVNNYSVILNGADNKIFFNKKKISEINKNKLKLVTHHWGASYFKGWDIYKKIDILLDNPKYRNKLEFHYIGQKPDDIKTRNIIFHESFSGQKLGDEIMKNDIYVTGSVNEPAGMHHIEGALCGLPLLYRESGALPEYCEGFGVSFVNEKDFEKSLNEIIEDYEKYFEKIKKYSKTSEKMCREYTELFQKLIENKKNIIAKRKENLGSRKFRINFFLKYYYFYILNKFLHFY